MILEVDEELYELILQTLMDYGYDDFIEDIVVYQEDDEKKFWSEMIDIQNDYNKPKSKKKKNKKICSN